MKNTVVISAFPACGKTYAYDNFQSSDLVIADSDSSEFSWIKDSDGNNTKERNPEFPKNYMEHIKSLVGEVDIIFVSSHKQVRKALVDEGISFITIYPDITERNAWVGRMYLRGNNKSFIDFIYNNWKDMMLESLYSNLMGEDTIRLKGNQYITKSMLKALLRCDFLLH